MTFEINDGRDYIEDGITALCDALDPAYCDDKTGELYKPLSPEQQAQSDAAIAKLKQLKDEIFAAIPQWYWDSLEAIEKEEAFYFRD